MRNVIMLGAAVLFAGAVGVAVAQERLPQHSGFGTGVGENAGVGSRSQIWDKQALLERLDQPETVMGRIFAIDLAQNRLMIETGGTGINEQAAEGTRGAGARTVVTLHLTNRSNIEQIKSLNVGDEVTIQAREETTTAQPYGTGKKIALDVTLLREEETQVGFGGYGQRPDPVTERAINTQNFSYHGAPIGEVLPGDVQKGGSSVGEVTGTAPCWNCAPQPGWGDNNAHGNDYGNYDDPAFSKK